MSEFVWVVTIDQGNAHEADEQVDSVWASEEAAQKCVGEILCAEGHPYDAHYCRFEVHQR